MNRTKIETMISSLRILENDIISEDGVANACVLNASYMLEELANELDSAYAFIYSRIPTIEPLCEKSDVAKLFKEQHLNALHNHIIDCQVSALESLRSDFSVTNDYDFENAIAYEASLDNLIESLLKEKKNV